MTSTYVVPVFYEWSGDTVIVLAWPDGRQDRVLASELIAAFGLDQATEAQRAAFRAGYMAAKLCKLCK